MEKESIAKTKKNMMRMEAKKAMKKRLKRNEYLQRTITE